MKKTMILTILLLCAALLLSGCASNAGASPTDNMTLTSPGASPNVTTSPGMNSDTPGNGLGALSTGMPGAGAAQQIETAEDALTASKALRDAVIKLTEVDTASAVAVGNTALVGVKYDESYQGGLDDRLRGMILTRAQTVSPAITSVAVTDKEEEITQINSLFQMLQNGSPYTTVQANADTMTAGLDVYK